MLRSKFDMLRAQKEHAENRKLTLETIAAESGLALATVHRVSAGTVDKTYLTTIATLCDYFGLTTLDELIEYSPGENLPHNTKAKKAAT